MRTSHQTLLPAAVLLFIGLAVMPASAFYNPNTGRWLSRDPIEENGGANLSTFVHQNPVGFVDSNGLRLIDEGIIQVSVEFIQTLSTLLTGHGTAFGATWAPASVTGQDVISPTPAGGMCGDCAVVKEVGQIDVTLTTYIPNNGLDKAYTATGLAGIVGHELTHRKIYLDSYNAYIAPYDGLAKRCGVICRNQPGEAVAELTHYVTTLRQYAIDFYNAWSGIQNGNLDAFEGSPLIQRYTDNGLFDGFRDHYHPEQPPMNQWPACPPPF